MLSKIVNLSDLNPDQDYKSSRVKEAVPSYIQGRPRKITPNKP